MPAKQTERRKYFPYYIIIFFYVLTSLIVIVFDLGDNLGIQFFTSIITSIIPSIEPTADLTVAPHSVEFVLSFSWVLVVAIAFKMVLFVQWRDIDYEGFYKKHSIWVLIVSIICALALIMFMAGIAPQNTGVFGKFVYGNLKYSIYFAIFYGLSIWVCLSACLFYIVFNLIYLGQKIKKWVWS